MKKFILLLCAFGLVLGLPMASDAMSATDNVRKIAATAYQKFDGINVTGGIKNSNGRVTIKDSMKVNKVGIFKGNANIKGVIKNTLSGIPVKIDDELRVYGFANFKDIVKMVGLRLEPASLAGITGQEEGDIYYDSDTDTPYYFDGTAWVPMAYTAGTGINLNSGQFTVNQSFSPTWTGNHVFNNEQVDFEGDVEMGSSTNKNPLEVTNTVRYVPLTGQPGTCNTGTEGTLYYETSANAMCFCDGAGWKYVDGETSCGGG